MTLIVETGLGIRNANAYVDVAFVTTYLTNRNQQTAWLAATEEERQAAIVQATDYIDNRFGPRFPGSKAVEFTSSQATATLTIGAIEEADTITLGDQVFVLMVGDTASDITALINATSRHATATAAGAVVTLTALANGAGGNLTTLTTISTGIVIVAFTGGLDGGLQCLEWPRENVSGMVGTIPIRVKHAVAEYAARAIVGPLLPDQTDFNGVVVRRFEKVGPIEEQFTYAAGTQTKFRAYPAADILLQPLLTGGLGRVIRA